MKKIKLFVAVPTVNSVTDSHSFFLRKIEKKFKNEIEFIYPENLVRRIFHDYARNEMVKEFLASEADAMWFLDSDVSPPTDILRYITKYWDRWKVAGAPYPVFMTPPGSENPNIVFTVYNLFPKGFAPVPIPQSGIDYVDAVATGCIFIKREVFSKLEEPYFEFVYDPKTRNLKEGEDIGFCRKLNDLGYKFFIDYSMVCKHQKNVCLLEMNNYAIEYAKRSIDAYDRHIKEKIRMLEQHFREKMTQSPLAKSKIILPE